MIPVVQRGSGADGRKGKQLLWREARLCLARASDRTQGLYGATLGSAQSAGWMWRELALKAGLDRRSQVHGLGDGAPWIVDAVFRGQLTASGVFCEPYGPLPKEQAEAKVDFRHLYKIRPNGLFYESRGKRDCDQLQPCQGQGDLRSVNKLSDAVNSQV
jgi:hypothetical protein